MSEQFRVPKVNVIESSQGFAVEVLGRTGLRYTEGGRDLFIDSEVLAAGFGLLVIANSIQNWGPKPRSSGDLERAERVRIIENIQRAFASQGEKIEIKPENWRVA
ncbi:MAG: hypothetical protein ACXU9O_15220 [Gemmatimonadaceae bacterium]